MLLPHKIPILPTINDVPSIAGQPSHPNASLLCKKYNDLIEALDVSVGSTVTAKQPLTTNLYIDTTLSIDGEGTQANPFNSVQSLVTKLNNSILGNNILVICLSNVNLGNFIISPQGTITNDEPNSISFVGETSNKIINIQLLNSTVAITFTENIVLSFTNLIIANSILFLDIPINNGELKSYNSTIFVKNMTNINLTLFNCNLLTNTNNNSLVFENIMINAELSNIYLTDIDAPYIPNSLIDSIVLNINNSNLTVLNSTIGNFNASFFNGDNNNIKLDNNIFTQQDDEQSFINFGIGNILYRRNNTFPSNAFNSSAIFHIDNGVIQ